MPQVKVYEHVESPSFFEYLQRRRYGWEVLEISPWEGYHNTVLRYSDQKGHAFEVMRDSADRSRTHLRVFVEVPPAVTPEWLLIMLNDYKELMSKWGTAGEKHIQINYVFS